MSVHPAAYARKTGRPESVDRILALENAVKELQRENASLRVHLKGALETAINDAKNLIQSSIRVPQDGLPGRDGVDGQSIVGPKGERGDVLIPNADELKSAVVEIRKRLAKHMAAIAVALERNELRQHPGLRSAVRSVLIKLRQDTE